MLPLSRRRARRRSISRRLTFVLVGAVVLALIIGGFTQISRQSQGYDQGVLRSLVAQDSVIANESAATSVQMRRLMGDMQTLDRRTLQAALDSVVQQTADQDTRAKLAAGSASSSQLGGRLASVFADRAQALSDVRGAIDGLLGMHPLPVAGASVSTAAVANPGLLTSTQATDRMAAAGLLLAQSDATYRAVRTELRRDRSRYRLPASVWITSPQSWQLGALALQMDLVGASGSLAAVHDLTLQTVRLDPPALPTAVSTAQGTSVLSPTNSITVTVVLSNLGSVDEPKGAVQFSLAPQSGGSAVTTVRRVGVPSGGSVTLDAVSFGVKPGTTYQLTVTVIPPAGEAPSANSEVSQTLQIAPGT
jgi:hypothetical protein